jgi:hypothetical protein
MPEKRPVTKPAATDRKKTICGGTENINPVTTEIMNDPSEMVAITFLLATSMSQSG